MPPRISYDNPITQPADLGIHDSITARMQEFYAKPISTVKRQVDEAQILGVPLNPYKRPLQFLFGAGMLTGTIPRIIQAPIKGFSGRIVPKVFAPFFGARSPLGAIGFGAAAGFMTSEGDKPLESMVGGGVGGLLMLAPWGKRPGGLSGLLSGFGMMEKTQQNIFNIARQGTTIGPMVYGGAITPFKKGRKTQWVSRGVHPLQRKGLKFGRPATITKPKVAKKGKTFDRLMEWLVGKPDEIGIGKKIKETKTVASKAASSAATAKSKITLNELLASEAVTDRSALMLSLKETQEIQGITPRVIKGRKTYPEFGSVFDAKQYSKIVDPSEEILQFSARELGISGKKGARRLEKLKGAFEKQAKRKHVKPTFSYDTLKFRTGTFKESLGLLKKGASQKAFDIQLRANKPMEIAARKIGGGFGLEFTSKSTRKDILQRTIDVISKKTGGTPETAIRMLSEGAQTMQQDVLLDLFLKGKRGQLGAIGAGKIRPLMKGTLVQRLARSTSINNYRRMVSEMMAHTGPEALMSAGIQVGRKYLTSNDAVKLIKAHLKKGGLTKDIVAAEMGMSVKSIGKGTLSKLTGAIAPVEQSVVKAVSRAGGMTALSTIGKLSTLAFVIGLGGRVVKSVGKQAINTIDNLSRTAAALQQPEFGSGRALVTPQGTTERQRALTAINQSSLNARTYLGREAKMFAGM